MQPMIRLDQTYRFGLTDRARQAGPAPLARAFARLRFGLPAPPAAL
ncbi:MAG: hypothetical protein JSR87_01135 [Proteobacteria bacterium]|nr:hypothetical protein [Pseudomonadota bacterium]MBS0573535.1 hypothetical protein [Pseudomonadota bacterium]